MMEPRIQYAKTADGVSIALWTLGEGIPFVVMPALGTSHIQLEWQVPEWRLWYERLAEKRKLIRYDHRGAGLSDREATDFSLDAHLRDLEAVVDRLGLMRFVLLGPQHAGPVAITYAARHPERLSHLILWCAYARASDFVRSSPRLQAVRALRDKDWEVYTETVAHVAFGWSAGEESRRFAAFMRECITPDVWRVAIAATEEFDVTPLLPHVQSPTLVMHRRQVAYPVVDLGRDLATRIPDARLVVLEGTTIAPWEGMELFLDAVDDFLGEGAPAAAGGAAPGAFRTVLFTDVEGSTALTQRLGDAKARQVLREHERITREALKAHGGTEVKTMGDGFMACFTSATRALECAIAMQRAFADHNEALLRQAQDEHTEPVEVRVRIGLNAGEPIAEDEDLFGTAVILAARIAAKAEGGEIVVSDTVRGLVAGKGFLFSDQGDVVLRGFEDPVRLYEVRWRENA
jgi:class 3 adenylate cyclase